MTQIISIIGYLGQDPELKTTEEGQKVCNFTVAVNDPRDKEDEDGNKPDPTWYNVGAWGGQAQACKDYLASGKRAFVSGSFRVRPWIDKDGYQRYSYDINAHEVTFLSEVEGKAGERKESKTSGNRPKAKAGSAAD